MLELWQVLLIATAGVSLAWFAIRMRRRSAPPTSTESLNDVMNRLTDKTSELQAVVRNLVAEGKRAEAVEAARPLAPLFDMTPEQVADQIENERR